MDSCIRGGWALLALACILCSPGCIGRAPPPPEWSPPEEGGAPPRVGVDPERDPMGGEVFDVRDASLSGDLGSVLSFAVEPADTEAYRMTPSRYTLEVGSVTDSGENVLAIVTLVGVLDQEPGTTHTYGTDPAEGMFTGEEVITGEEVFMLVQGCSGSSDASSRGMPLFDWDALAEQVDVTVVPVATNPAVYNVHFVAHFNSALGDQQAEGSFDIEVPDESGTTAPGP